MGALERRRVHCPISRRKIVEELAKKRKLKVLVPVAIDVGLFFPEFQHPNPLDVISVHLHKSNQLQAIPKILCLILPLRKMLLRNPWKALKMGNGKRSESLSGGLVC